MQALILVVALFAGAALLDHCVYRFSGFKTLAERYPLRGGVPQGVRGGDAVCRRWIGFSRVKYAADERALYIMPFAHLAFLDFDAVEIPWREIEAFEERRNPVWGRNYGLVARGARDIDVAVDMISFNRLLRAAVEKAGVPIRPERS